MILKLNEICFHYHRSREIVNRVSFTFEENKIYALLGENASGKTTLLNLIMGNLTVTSGRIFWNSAVFKKKDAYQISFTLDEPSFPNYLSGYEWILLYLRLYKKTIDENKLSELCEMLQLNEIKNFIESYSLGMRKKLSLLAMFMAGCSINLIDESLAGIDPKTLKRIYAFLNHYKEKHIVIISSHSKDLINSVSDEFLQLRDGKLKKVKSFDEAF